MSSPLIDNHAWNVLLQEREHLLATTTNLRRVDNEFPGAGLEGLVKKVEAAWQEVEAELAKRQRTMSAVNKTHAWL